MRSVRWIGAVIAVMLGGCCSSGPRHAEVFEHAAVAADHEIASEAGAEILRAGGNAVDAAVATSFTLSVVRPYSCGIGGGGFMVIHLQDDPRFGTMQTAINYRETAPGAVEPDYYERLGDPLASVRGGKAIGVPGTVAGLLHALETYGTMELATVMAPAIRAAERGFRTDAHYASSARGLIEDFEANPEWKERFAFVWERYLLWGDVEVGDRIRVPEQARALRLIAELGAAGFYEGEVGEAILRAIAADGGEMTAEDLAGYEPREVEPLRFGFYGHEIVGMPPPSSGGVAMGQILGLLERWNIDFALRKLPAYTSFGQGIGDAFAEYYVQSFFTLVPLMQPGDLRSHRPHLYVEAFKHAFADRSRFLGDPAFADVPVEALLDPGYLDRLARRSQADKTFGPEHYGAAGLEGDNVPAPLAIDGGTSHFCVVDRHGNAVSCTETINFEFGSLVAVPEFGFCLNDEMDDFTTVRGEANAFGLRQSDLNLPEPGKRPLSSMSPTIALDREGRVAALAGASGGPRIITGTTQVLVPMLLRKDEGGDPADVLRWPRLHHQWSPNTLRLDEEQDSSLWWWDDSTVAALEDIGHEIEPIANVGNVQAIRRNRKGEWEAASDPNKGGRPAGY